MEQRLFCDYNMPYTIAMTMKYEYEKKNKKHRDIYTQKQK